MKFPIICLHNFIFIYTISCILFPSGSLTLSNRVCLPSVSYDTSVPASRACSSHVVVIYLQTHTTQTRIPLRSPIRHIIISLLVLMEGERVKQPPLFLPPPFSQTKFLGKRKHSLMHTLTRKTSRYPLEFNNVTRDAILDTY